jgi:hypothetical protein
MLLNNVAKYITILATAVAATATGCLASAPAKTFKLKTTGSTNAAHNSLYVTSYHTGAGTSDPVLSTNAAGSSVWQLNDTQVVYIVNDVPYGFIMYPAINYASKSMCLFVAFPD